MSSDDHLLLASAAAGDAGALEALMSRHSARVYRLAYGISRNTADAEEIVQDVFLQMVLKGGSFEGRAALGTWLYRVTTNTALNKRRGKRHQMETSLDDVLPTFTADGHREGDRAYLVADWSATPDRELLSGESRRILKDVEELSNEEVAEAVGDSVAAVKTRLHRARMAVREHVTRRLGVRA
jgi:RNA polymerase sigma-70 factor (ECF subfamily)